MTSSAARVGARHPLPVKGQSWQDKSTELDSAGEEQTLQNMSREGLYDHSYFRKITLGVVWKVVCK